MLSGGPALLAGWRCEAQARLLLCGAAAEQRPAACRRCNFRLLLLLGDFYLAAPQLARNALQVLDVLSTFANPH